MCCHRSTHASVDGDGLSGDVRCPRSADEAHGRGDVVRSTHAAHGDLREDGLPTSRGEVLGHVGVDEARRDDVDRHIATCVLLREAAGGPSCGQGSIGEKEGEGKAQTMYDEMMSIWRRYEMRYARERHVSE